MCLRRRDRAGSGECAGALVNGFLGVGDAYKFGGNKDAVVIDKAGDAGD